VKFLQSGLQAGTSFFHEDPDVWTEEVGREDGDWDLLVPGDLDENHAYKTVEEYVKNLLGGGEKKKKGKKEVQEEKAATKIQSKARAKHAKKEVAEKKKERQG
jgi:hypothetical protein